MTKTPLQEALPERPDKRRKFTLSDEAYLRLSCEADTTGVYISEVLEDLIMTALDPPPVGYEPAGRKGKRRYSRALARRRYARDPKAPATRDMKLEDALKGEI